MRTSRSPATCSNSSGAKAQKPPWVGKNASSRVPSFPVGGELAPRTWIKITSPGRALPGWISNSGSDPAAFPPSSAAANARAPSIRGYLLEDCTAASAHHKQFTPMKVLVADDLSPESIEILRREKNLSVDVRIGLKPPELKAEIFQYHALAVRSATKVTAEIIEAGKNLKVIGRAGVGVDNVDLEAANRRGVVVMNTPGGNTITVAEHAIAMMLALARHIPQATASMKAGQWEKKRFQGRELFNKTLGVIGVGNIGSVVVERCIGMKMKVIAYDPFISPEAARRMGCELAPLEQALTTGRLGGAALDVFSEEPLRTESPLLKLENFICTPHLGASTAEAQRNVAIALAEQLVDFLCHGNIRNAVNAPSVSNEVLEKLGPWLNLAHKLGMLAGQLSPEELTSIEVEISGEVNENPTAPITVQALKGFLSQLWGESVNEVSAPALAKERGIAVVETHRGETAEFTSSVALKVKGKTDLVVEGTVFGRREPRIVRVNEFDIEAVPAGHLIAIHNQDIPGVVGRVGTSLGTAGVNIARIHLSRDRDRKEAFSLINVDSAPEPALLGELGKINGVLGVKHIVL